MSMKKRSQSSKKGRHTPKRSVARRNTTRTRMHETSSGSGRDERSQSGALPFREVPPIAGTKSPVRSKQSGDLQNMETDERESFESVSELAEEGQDLEAARLEGIENTPEPDKSELKPRKAPSPSVPHKFEDRNRL